MPNYIDGFLTPVPKKNLKKYLAHAKLGRKVWLEHGALEYWECMADDVPGGEITSFPQSVKLKKNEVVFMSWVVYKSASDRKRIMGKVMNDPRMQSEPETWPFDGMRMIYGGFKPVVVGRAGKKSKKARK